MSGWGGCFGLFFQCKEYICAAFVSYAVVFLEFKDEVGRSLVVLAVERSFLCSFLRGVSCGGGWWCLWLLWQ